MSELILIKLQPNARMHFRSRSPDYSVTKEDFPPKEMRLAGIPRVGDAICLNDDTGMAWQVTGVIWTDGIQWPTVEVE
jgi:hypothetical protein